MYFQNMSRQAKMILKLSERVTLTFDPSASKVQSFNQTDQRLQQNSMSIDTQYLSHTILQRDKSS